MCAVLQMNVQLGIPSHSVSWWALKIPWNLSRSVGELSLARWPNSWHTHSNDATSSHHKQNERTTNESAPPPHHSHPHYRFIKKHIINFQRQKGNSSTATPRRHKTRIKQAEKPWWGRTSYSFSSFSFPFHGHPAGLNTKPATRAEELLVSKQPYMYLVPTASADVLLQLLTFTRRLMAVFALWPPQNTL